MSDQPPASNPPPARRRGLGRGLGALLSSTTVVPPPAGADESLEGALVEIDIARITPNPEQPRRDFDIPGIEALADSMRVHGVLQPIVVEPVEGGYRLIAGERRLRAARLAGLTAISAVVRPATESARHALELALVENLQRTDLSPLEEAAAYARLADAFGMSHEAIGRRVGKTRPSVSNAIRLLNLPASAQASLAAARINTGHARALLSLRSASEQEALLHEIEEHGLTVKQVERAVEALLSGVDIAALPRPEPPRGARGGPHPVGPTGHPRPQSVDDMALMRGLEAALGTPVLLQRRRRGGRLIIEFYTDEDLDALYTRLGGPPL